MSIGQIKNISRDQQSIIDRGEHHEWENQQGNLSDMWTKYTYDILLPMLRHPYSLYSTSGSDDSNEEEDEEDGYLEPMPEVDADGAILESHRDPRYHVANNRRKILTQQLISTSNSRTQKMVYTFIQKINVRRLTRVN